MNNQIFIPYQRLELKNMSTEKIISIIRIAAKNYTLSDTERIIRYLGEMDGRIKTTSTDWLPVILSSLVVDIIMNKGRESSLRLDTSPLEISI